MGRETVPFTELEGRGRKRKVLGEERLSPPLNWKRKEVRGKYWGGRLSPPLNSKRKEEKSTVGGRRDCPLH